MLRLLEKILISAITNVHYLPAGTYGPVQLVSGNSFATVIVTLILYSTKASALPPSSLPSATWGATLLPFCVRNNNSLSYPGSPVCVQPRSCSGLTDLDGSPGSCWFWYRLLNP